MITGGLGLIGRAIAAHLQHSGWEILLTDIAPECDIPGVTYAACNIMDFEGLKKLMRGCDAVVHMAALRNPFYGPNQEVFRVNTTGTFNVFEAAAQEGIRRVVQASSINAIGCAWNLTEFSPRYLPVDEDHPTYTTDSYSFSKSEIEDIGAYFWRRDGIISTALRYPGVYQANARQGEAFRKRRSTARTFMDDLMSRPEDEQRQLIADVRERSLAYRASRPLEYPRQYPPLVELPSFDDLLWRVYTFDRYNLWASIDERDAAQAVEKSLTADFTGSHALFVNDSHNWLGYDSHALTRVFYPEVNEWRQTVTGSESLVSIQRARDLIGFEPQYSAHGEET